MDLLDHYLQIILLGIVEGVTEFLPISSTGHLLIAEGLLKIHEPDVFNVVIQAGAILAVVFIYWSKLADLFGSLDKAASRAYLLKIFVAFLVTGAIGFALTHHFHLKLPETLTPVAWATFIGGLVILLIEFLAKNLYPHDDISWPEAILIGLAQVLAGIFPGTSRSGATIMTGLTMGMKRPLATEFSFLIGIPTMFAASGLELVKYRKDITSGGHQLVLDIALGFVVSAVVAFFVIKWLLRFVQSHTFNGFAIYRILLGGGLLIALYTGVIPELGADVPETKVTELSAPAPMAVVIPAPPPEANAAVSVPGDLQPISPVATPDQLLAPAAKSAGSTAAHDPVVPINPAIANSDSLPVSAPSAVNNRGSSVIITEGKDSTPQATTTSAAPDPNAVVPSDAPNAPAVSHSVYDGNGNVIFSTPINVPLDQAAKPSTKTVIHPAAPNVPASKN